MKWAIGKRGTHWDGREIEIVSGSYLGDYGRVSNHWGFREVLPSGKLSKKLEYDYGRWDLDNPPDAIYGLDLMTMKYLVRKRKESKLDNN